MSPIGHHLLYNMKLDTPSGVSTPRRVVENQEEADHDNDNREHDLHIIPPFVYLIISPMA